MAERKDAPSSVLTGRETSTAIQASTDRLNTQKSPSSERDKNPVDVPALNVKSTKKSAAPAPPPPISEESAEDVDKEKEDRSRDSNKRKRYNAVEFKARYKSQRVRVETEGSEVPSQTKSAAVGDGTPVANETADGNVESLYQHLKPTVSEHPQVLGCKAGFGLGYWSRWVLLVNFVSLVLSMSAFEEDAKIIVERFLKFVVGDFNVSKEHTSTLQALMISVLKQGSEVPSQTKSAAVGDGTPVANETADGNAESLYQHLKPTVSELCNILNFSAVPLNPQEQKRENHGSPNKEALQSSRQILEEDIARKERNETDKLEKLKLVEKEFADELNKHEKLRPVVSGSHTSEKHMANATVVADATALSEPTGDIPAKHVADMGNDVAGADASVLSEPIGDIPAIEDIASEQQDDVANVVVSGDDAMVSSDSNKNGSNDTSLHADSDQMGIPAANDLTPHIEYVDGSHAVEDPTGTGPHHGAPNVESAELAIPAGNCNQDKAQDTTPSVQQVASPVSDHSMPAIPSFQEIHNDSNLLQQPSENGIQDQEGQADPTPTVETTAEDSSLNPHDEPSSVISTDQIQLGQYLFDLQRNANFNQAASLRTGGVDPLHIELLQLSSVRDKMVKSHHDNILKMNIDCEKEIAEAIAEIRLKYCNKHQEADATYNSQKKEVENNMNTVVMNQLLAACFRRKCQDDSGGCAAVQQARQAESMQQQRKFLGTLTYTPGQSSGTQQTPPPIPATSVATPPQRTQPPLQII
ncbi:P-loop containing nucleoside triphosphate hydrolase [Tanacetum coccineum]